MPGRNGAGLGKRRGYLDRETVNENRAIMREYERAQRSERPERQNRGRYRNILLEVAGRSRRDDVRSAAEVLAEHLASGESPAEAGAAADRALSFVHREMSRTIERDWEKAKSAVLAAWARTMGKGSKEAEEILAALPQRPEVDRTVRDQLVAAGEQANSWKELERSGRALATLLASGTAFTPAAARTWKKLVQDVPEEERKELGRKWSEISRALQLEWAKSHPEDAPPERPARTERPARKVPVRRNGVVRLDPAGQERLELLEVAAADAPSWQVLQPEGMHLVQLVAAGASFPQAVEETSRELEERRENLDDDGWALVQLEWGKVLAIVGRAAGAL